MKTKLNLGCGKEYKEKYFNVDIRTDIKTDLILDLNKKRWPFKSNSFKTVYSKHTLEHLDNVQAFMDEVWRITKNNAKVTIIVPHYSGAAAPSPFHKQTFSSQSMNYFTRNPVEKYGKATFDITKTEIHWFPSANEKYVQEKFLRLVAREVGRVVDVFINLNPVLFERVWCYWIGGAFEIEWVLKTRKSDS